MSNPLKCIYLAIACLWLGYAALVISGLGTLNENVWASKHLWGALLLCAAFGAAPWKLSHSRALNLLLLGSSLLLVEGALQIIAWSGLLPGVNTKIRAPYGRVYWTREGLGNSIRNRFGWYYPAFTEARHNIALVGDSFVEAVEIHRRDNLGVTLEGLLRAEGQDAAVMAFGNHGSSPAYHIDVLDHAARHFAPEEAVLFVYVGNDITENSPEFNRIPPDRFLYYDLGSEGELVLNPASRPIRDGFLRQLELCYQPLVRTAWNTLSGHFMIVQTAVSLRDYLRASRAAKGRLTSAGDDEIARDMRQLGLVPEVFRANPGPETERALAVLLKTIAACKASCERHRMRLRMVTIPAFPQWFYATQKGRDWTTRFEQYDFQTPEQRIAAFAVSNGIPTLELGRYMKTKGLDVEQVRDLYLTRGSGHFSAAGHRFCAEAIYDTFYRGQPATAASTP